MAIVAQVIGFLLILLTAASSLAAVRRHRDWRRFDILFVVVSLFAAVFLTSPRPLFVWARLLAQVAIPFLLLRLVSHVRNISVVVWTVFLAFGAFAFWTSLDTSWRTTVFALLAIILLYPATLLLVEAGRTLGVTRMRLRFAAAGSALIALSYGLASASTWIGEHAAWTFSRRNILLTHEYDLNAVLTLSVIVCFYLAFSTPRGLRARWQRTEQARYLSLTAERDAEDRGRHAPEDLEHAADRSVANAVVLVALRPTASGGDLSVRAVSRSAFGNVTTIRPGGLIGRVIESGKAASGRPLDGDPALAPRLAAVSATLLVAPIFTSSRVWGVVIVAQRRGSLFPEDDLVLLGQLGRYAGTALEHAALISEGRERERLRADRRLREVESRMSLMLDSIKDYAMFVMDEEGYVVTWHVGARHVFGHSSDEMVGESATPLYNVTPDEFRKRLDDARSTGAVAWEGTCYRRDGDRFVGTTVVRPLEIEATDMPGFVAVTRDVSERRRLEERIRQGQKMEAVGLLASGITHDFNNVILAISGFAGWLERDCSADPKRLDSVQEILRAAARAKALTDGLTAFTRRKTLEAAPIHLGRRASGLLPMLRPLIGEHIEIVMDLAPDLARVMGDGVKVDQVIMNLAVNARDAMPSGGRLTIRVVNVELDRGTDDLVPGPYVLLEAQDTGVGMDAATRERIFEPFFTTKDVGKGTGLGLATVYGIVRQMSGIIRVDSEPNRGATFRIYFPATVRPEAAPEAPPPTLRTGGSETLLVVEDDDAVRKFLTRTLEHHGYVVVAAAHPMEALDVVTTGTTRFDLVITDVVMPGSVGPEFVRELTRLRGPMPVLYMSGNADAAFAWRDDAPKANHFLQKPFSATDLLTRIREILASP